MVSVAMGNFALEVALEEREPHASAALKDGGRMQWHLPGEGRQAVVGSRTHMTR